MATVDMRNLFGVTLTTAYIRALPYSPLTAQMMCQGVGKGFGLSTEDADKTFTYFRTEGLPDTSRGFFENPYLTYEAAVAGVLDTFLPSSANVRERALLTVAAHALIFAYTLNEAITLTEFEELMGEVLMNVSSSVLQMSYFKYEGQGQDAYIPQPFTGEVLLNLLKNDYSLTLELLASGDKSVNVNLTNYNWYDASSLFAGPNSRLMKDIENQYYYLSGRMIYESAYGSLEPCIEDETTINTSTGQVTFSYVRNVPCKEPSSYVGPVNYLAFKRVFNDGPSSSGRFTTEVQQFYVNNDKLELASGDYLSNAFDLMVYTGGSLAPSVHVDINGQYSLTSQEYNCTPTTYSCSVPYVRMHIGDNRPRYICDGAKTCNCVETNLTGFKYASVFLPDEIWTSDFQFRQTNPLSDVERIRKRAWCLDDHHYVATEESGVLMPYFQDITPPFTKHWYVGYPQLNGGGELPELAFFQTFDSPTFGDTASVAIYPAIGVSFGNDTSFAESDRSFTVEDMCLFSGQGALPVKFNVGISSNLSGKSLAIHKFFGMGNAFSGKYDIQTYAEENAGFHYTGFVVSETGVVINSQTLADNYSGSLVGGKYRTMKYISGYLRNDGAVFDLTNFYAKNATGDLFTYAYFNGDAWPDYNLQTKGWSYLAPVPPQLDNEEHSPVFVEQTVENYLPRYYDGPFSVETRKFLYPNMMEADSFYAGKTNGVPTGVSFKLTVREEAVREIYAKFSIYPDGSVDEEPTYIPVMRSDVLSQQGYNPSMRTIFIPDDSMETQTYDFNRWPVSRVVDSSIGTNLVDNLWAPATETSCYPVGRNGVVYNRNDIVDQYFTMGLRKTRDGAVQFKVYGTGGLYKFHYGPNPLGAGLFHKYVATEFEGTLSYTLPIFDVTQNAMVVNEAMTSTFPAGYYYYPSEGTSFEGMWFFPYGGFHEYAHTGMEPMYCQWIGGRRGGPTATQEGGYNVGGVIGDQWLGFCYKNYSYTVKNCYSLTHTYSFYPRYPQGDDTVILIAATPTGTHIHTNGLRFGPYRVDRYTSPLLASQSFPYATDNQRGNLTVWQSGSFVNFNLATFFPIKSRTGIGVETQSYYKSGLRLGPFDRDVEVGMVKGQKLAAYSDFYINSQQLSHIFYAATSCDKLWAIDRGIGETVGCGQPFYSNARDSNYTILAVIAKGDVLSMNVKSAVDFSSRAIDTELGYPPEALTHIGISGSSVLLSMRTHVPLDGNDYSSHLDSGEYQRLESLSFVNNGIKSVYVIPHDGLEGLAGTHTFNHYGYSGVLYPKPNENDFTGYGVFDANGNISYDLTLQAYWRKYAMRSGVVVVCSGYREGSRVSFNFSNMQPFYDKLNYQTYRLVAPSGVCRLSGEMGYYSQADNCIFSEGIYLTNATPDDDMADMYNPSYVSDVLNRLPSGFFNVPTTVSGHMPVLPAPSSLRRRKNFRVIEEGQEYELLLREPPYDYNKMYWPALSDLETLNPGQTIESIAPGDGYTFPQSTMLFSASQGQALPNGSFNPNIMKRYYVQNIFQMYDSVATDAVINSGYCITSGRGTSVELKQELLSGALAPVGTPLTFVVRGLY